MATMVVKVQESPRACTRMSFPAVMALLSTAALVSDWLISTATVAPTAAVPAEAAPAVVKAISPSSVWALMVTEPLLLVISAPKSTRAWV